MEPINFRQTVFKKITELNMLGTESGCSMEEREEYIEDWRDL